MKDTEVLTATGPRTPSPRHCRSHKHENCRMRARAQEYRVYCRVSAAPREPIAATQCAASWGGLTFLPPAIAGRRQCTTLSDHTIVARRLDSVSRSLRMTCGPNPTTLMMSLFSPV